MERVGTHGVSWDTNCTETVTLIVPGHGEAKRSRNLLAQLRKLRQQWAPGCFACQVFVYAPTRLRLEAELEDECKVARMEGLWTDFMQSLAPPRSTYVALCAATACPVPMHGVHSHSRARQDD